ncbi:hypothetical protein KUTeg_014449 [Tegillarca granosa]|uniref:Uncharacterized protein n=1 Tax=Tegillarca granosa TaxID=220873 RepID=A0ABQ9EWK4_TEGGR|nr:hypothetical protein KUTeg_014449 [Tegillarca granosa]
MNIVCFNIYISITSYTIIKKEETFLYNLYGGCIIVCTMYWILLYDHVNSAKMCTVVKYTLYIYTAIDIFIFISCGFPFKSLKSFNYNNTTWSQTQMYKHEGQTQMYKHGGQTQMYKHEGQTQMYKHGGQTQIDLPKNIDDNIYEGYEEDIHIKARTITIIHSKFHTMLQQYMNIKFFWLILIAMKLINNNPNFFTFNNSFNSIFSFPRDLQTDNILFTWMYFQNEKKLLQNWFYFIPCFNNRNFKKN